MPPFYLYQKLTNGTAMASSVLVSRTLEAYCCSWGRHQNRLASRRDEVINDFYDAPFLYS